MTDKETKEGFKVSDKRHFAVGENGKVTKRAEDEKAEKPADTAGEAEKAEAQDIDLDSCECEEDYDKLPPLDFASFVFSLSTSTMILLGILPDPTTKKMMKNLAMARQHIDLLGLLQEKTVGNLSKDEESFLQNALYDLRMKFVEACNPK